MDAVSIKYRIKLKNRVENFDFLLDSKTFDLITDEISDPPQWTELSFRQCSHCPLSEEEHSHCPLALQLYDIVEKFHDTRSIDEVELEVITEERTVTQTLAIQRAIASVIGLIIPVCGCPKTAYMKPMARFHLPLASEEETIFRVTGMYLLSQYFLSQNSKQSSMGFDGLAEIYADLHIVNAATASRLRSVTQSDSLKNAITLLDMYSMLVPALLEDQLIEMREFFGAYLPELKGKTVTTNYLKEAKAFSAKLIVPLDAELELFDEERPGWLEDDSPAAEPEAAETEEVVDLAEETESAADKILENAGLKLELEPQADEVASDEDGKAVFTLPEDE